MNRSGERGAALLMAVLVLTILSLGTTLVFRMLTQSMTQQTQMERDQQVFFIAEAGIEKAVALVRVTPGYTGELETPFGAGLFSLTVAPEDDGFRITSRGEIRDGSRVKSERKLVASVSFDSAGHVRSYHVVDGGREE